MDREKDHDEHTMSTPTRKRLLGFSLRTMLIVVTALCVLLAFEVRQVEQQKKVVAWAKQAEGRLRYDYEFGGRITTSFSLSPTIPKTAGSQMVTRPTGNRLSCGRS